MEWRKSPAFSSTDRYYPVYRIYGADGALPAFAYYNQDAGQWRWSFREKEGAAANEEEAKALALAHYRMA